MRPISSWLFLALFITLAIPQVDTVRAATDGTRRQIQLNEGWRFHLGEIQDAIKSSDQDSSWRLIDLPHDWSFEAGVSKEGAQGGSGGYYSGGIGWYRKTFDLPQYDKDQTVSVEFDGVYMNSEVWINDHRLGKFPYGYLSFRYDITEYLHSGKNTLTVRCDNQKEPSARWYHPCGIYAPVQLVIKNKKHLDNHFITTPSVTSKIAKVQVDAEFDGQDRLTLQHVLFDPSGKQIGITTSNVFSVQDPKLWSPETPSLYTLVTTAKEKDQVVDVLTSRFGIRSIAWKTETGFWLNGKNIKLKGVCEHWEGGPVGGAWTEGLLRWKLENLKAMGCNSIRTAHNPFPPIFYDLCDEMGFLVMDEIFDGWKKKARYDYGQQAFAQHWKRDLRTWIKRDRNHPSVIIWSLGNETGGSVGKELVRVCHELDPTRPVTSGHSGSQFMDVYGINGASESKTYYDKNKRPRDKPFVATEAPHTWQVRGYYRSKTWWRDGKDRPGREVFPLEDLTDVEIFTYDWKKPAAKANPVKQIFNSSYDNATVRISARKNWELMRDLPWYAGHFRWTGFDYPGEASYVHGGFPFRAFMGGSHDLAGFPKDLAYFYQSQWTEKPMVHLLPHWTHPKMELGTRIPVWAYSNAEEVELFLNQQSLGILRPGQKAEKMQCEWLVPWQPGELVAIGRNKGVEVAKASVSTAGPPAALSLTLSSQSDGTHVITTQLEDHQGTHTPYADNRVYLHLPAGVRLLSHENGNPIDTENGSTANSRRAFMGLTRSFVKTKSRSNLPDVLVGSILGSRNGVTEDSNAATVTIGLQKLSLNSGVATAVSDAFKIYYTIDGSTPDITSSIFEQSFSIEFPTTVKALVTYRGKPLFTMQEVFRQEAGLYWSDPSEQPKEFAMNIGMQAEEAQLLGNAVALSQGKDFHGDGYVDLSHKGDGISWYQENDGEAGVFTLRFRYAQQDGKGSRTADLIINGKKAIPLRFMNTGSWENNWKTTEYQAKLNAGANEIVLRANPRGGPRIDELVVE